MTQRARRIGLVGYGDVSVVHVDAIAAIDGLELVAVADADPAARERAATALGVPVHDSVEAMLDAERLDAIHVTTPHHEHVGPSLAAIARGVHVLQEKPVAHTLAEAERLVAGLAAAPARADGGAGAPHVAICFQNRYNRASQELRRLLTSGELGAVQGAYASVVWTRTAEYYAAKPWRGRQETSGGGLLINQAIHTLDLVQWLLGPVERTDGLVSQRKFAGVTEVEDTAELLLHHEGGATTTFYATLTAPVARPVELEVATENAYLELRSGAGGGLTVRWADGRVDTFSDRVATAGGRSYWGVSHEELIADFYATLDGAEPFWIGPAEGIASLRILKDAYAISGPEFAGC
ncbi:gfo/Idh/MocA family oxidoreductase [Brachybacterium sp. SGAir0954]|uniref:Gfo/Idh/MocA family protein n=1 Tax=Brachybacterium sp. SGAir0954 TaxID=2571029 RepID=UPI0010CD390D|nr:Gfo/Idh/MocA family oxidoreductase [Brachybacterium sp. SGAir0954]QCR52498.1 gfo/Idh/MocA family oxidoreductase [Brachybacterium sp. SGAir0954]